MASQQNGTSRLTINGQSFSYFALDAVAAPEALRRLPFCIKVLLENVLRNGGGGRASEAQIDALANWQPRGESRPEIAFTPARVLLQDFTGVPAIVDLAAMRDAIEELGGDPQMINPLAPVELVIDHSVQVDSYARADSRDINVRLEYARNGERYKFLRWGQGAFDNFKVVPPGTGIVHQVNLEYLARTVFREDGETGPLLYPDTLVGTDSHTTMINGLGVLGWGVGGIEAEAAMLGQAISMLVPQVIGVRLDGSLVEGSTATDLVLRVTELLREYGVVGKFVEFFGDGLGQLSLADRATIANMSPEYGATCGIFPIDEQTLSYLRLTGRSEEQIAIVEQYARAQHLFRREGEFAEYTDTLTLDLGSVVPSLAGPKRPQDRVALTDIAASASAALTGITSQRENADTPVEEVERFAAEGGGTAVASPALRNRRTVSTTLESESFDLDDGAIVIAAITSCTNTSNPSVMFAAGLLARNAKARGLRCKPWVKTSLAPGSQVVRDYLERAALLDDLDSLGFQIVGYGCTTCIGNSGPLAEPIAQAIDEEDLAVCAVLSGNRNFEGRIHPQVQLNYLASPPLVVAYALAGNMTVDLLNEPLGHDQRNKPVFLRDLWPSPDEVNDAIKESIDSEMFTRGYSTVFEGDKNWQALRPPADARYRWEADSTYIQQPPFFQGMGREPAPVNPIQNARVLCLLGDSVTTDHISPAGAISVDSPAGKYLSEHSVDVGSFNSYGSRRGNHEVMMRGTFGNLRLRNQLAPGTNGGWTRLQPDGEIVTIYDAAMRYAEEEVPLIVIAGKEYGTGSSRDWAAKGPLLLGVRAVIAESYERIHRSNLIGMGILPLEFCDGAGAAALSLDGSESYSIDAPAEDSSRLNVTVAAGDGSTRSFPVKVRIDTSKEWTYFRHGGILRYVLRNLLD